MADAQLPKPVPPAQPSVAPPSTTPPVAGVANNKPPLPPQQLSKPPAPPVPPQPAAPQPPMPPQVVQPTVQPTAMRLPPVPPQAAQSGTQPPAVPQPTLDTANNKPPVPKLAAVKQPPSGGAPKPKGAKTAKAASIKQASGGRPWVKWLPLAIGGVILLAVLSFAAVQLLSGGAQRRDSVSISSRTPAAQPATPPAGGTPNTQQPAAAGQQVVLTYWGLWEPASVMQPILDEFSQQYSGVIVQYEQQSFREYRERLQNAIVQGRGPDVFRYHASWTPMLRAELAELPSSVYSPTEFGSTFYPIIEAQCNYGGTIRCIPLMYDQLALYVNTEALANAGLSAPSTWSELQQAAQTLTLTEQGRITRAGVALGTAENVDHFSEILGLLMLQNGADLTNPTDRAAADALQFYTNFFERDQVWSTQLPNSTLAFAREEVAMIIAPSWRYHEIEASNPGLEFEVLPVPQLTDTNIEWATYWVEGVNRQSENADLGWELLAFLSEQPQLQSLYSSARQTRSFGAPFPRVDMAQLITDPAVEPFVTNADFAQSWYMNQFTHDNGINDQIIRYYTDAVNAVNSGTEPAVALETVAQGINQILRQYNVTQGAQAR